MVCGDMASAMCYVCSVGVSGTALEIEESTRICFAIEKIDLG